jgi:kinetochore protein Spc25, fungi type
MRTPQIDLATILQQQNPQIDLGIPVYDVLTRNFIKSLVNFKNRALVHIAERRNAQALEIKRAAEKAQALEAETNLSKAQELELLASQSSPLLESTHVLMLSSD